MWNSTGTGTVGRTAVLSEDIDYSHMAADSHVTVVRLHSGMKSLYLHSFTASAYIQSNLDELTSGTTKQRELNLNTIVHLPIPVPPLAEQERIVAKLDQIMPLIDELAERERESI